VRFMSHAGIVLVTYATATLAGCSPVEHPLPLAENPNACRGVGIEATLAGSPTDNRVTWLVRAENGNETPLVWPPGWKARFTPSLEVMDPSGIVRFRQGDLVSGACVKGPPDALNSVLMLDVISIVVGG
jgi:hypothetical protein